MRNICAMYMSLRALSSLELLSVRLIQAGTVHTMGIQVMSVSGEQISEMEMGGKAGV